MAYSNACNTDVHAERHKTVDKDCTRKESKDYSKILASDNTQTMKYIIHHDRRAMHMTSDNMTSKARTLLQKHHYWIFKLCKNL